MQECVFDKMAEFVEIFVVFALDKAVLFWRYYWHHPLVFRLFKDDIAVVAAIRQQMLRRDALNQL